MRDKTWTTKTFHPVSLETSNLIAHFIEKEKLVNDQNREAFFAWKLSRNNFGLSIASIATPLTSSETVSTCSITPKLFWLNGALVFCGQIGDTYTANEFQRRGIFGDLVNSARSSAYHNGIEIIYGLPNEQSFPGYIKKLGFREIDSFSLSKYTSVLPSNKKFMNIVLSHRKTVFSNKIVKIINGLIHCLIRCLAHFQKFIVRKSIQFVVTEVNTVTPEFDILWRNTRDKMSFAQVRDANYIRLRFIESPYSFKIFTVSKDQEMVAYFVTLDVLQDNSNFMQKTVIVDWLINPLFGRKLGLSILKAIIDGAKQRGSSIISSLHSDFDEQSLPFMRALFVKTKPKLPIILHTKDLFEIDYSHLAGWHFTMGDTDEF
jgi:hypothetical protein